MRARLFGIGSVRIEFIKYMTQRKLYCTVAVVRSFKLSRAEQSHFRNNIVSPERIVYNGGKYFIGMYCIALHCIALHCIVLSCVVLCFVVVVLYCIALYCTTLH